jgi:FkbM family methyltransferase
MMLGVAKTIFRASPFYRIYFARKHAVGAWSEEDDRVMRLYADFVHPNDLVFDIGANIGAHTKVFLRLGAKVVAIEPQRLCAAALRRSFGDRATIVNAAVSSEEGTGLLRSASLTVATISNDFIRRTTESDRFGKVSWLGKETVYTTTFDALVARYGIPAFTKIDVEGHEASVLKGLSHTLPALSLEFHPEMLDEANQCIRHLEGLARYSYSISLATNYTLGPWMTASAMLSFLGTAKGRGDVYARHKTPNST